VTKGVLTVLSNDLKTKHCFKIQLNKSTLYINDEFSKFRSS
jgi:hypothetical protein